MTTALRIVISEHSVRQALAEWKAEREAAEREVDAQAVARDRERSYTRAPADYAADLAPYVFALLMRHQERP